MEEPKKLLCICLNFSQDEKGDQPNDRSEFCFKKGSQVGSHYNGRNFHQTTGLYNIKYVRSPNLRG